MAETRNLQDRFRAWENDLIRQDLNNNALPYAVCVLHLHGDLNLATTVRNANAFGAREVFYYQGKRHWDKRGAVGTFNYTNVQYLKEKENLIALRNKYPLFVGIENNMDGTVKLRNIKKFPRNCLFIFGEEGTGLDQETKDLCDFFIEIPMMGSVRSLNVGTASGILMHHVMESFKENENNLEKEEHRM